MVPGIFQARVLEWVAIAFSKVLGRRQQIRTSWNVKSSGPKEPSLQTKLVEVMGFQLRLFQILPAVAASRSEENSTQDCGLWWCSGHGKEAQEDEALREPWVWPTATKHLAKLTSTAGAWPFSYQSGCS